MRIENFWIGYRDLTVINKGMKLSDIATALKDDFPDLYEDYLIYREMKKRFDPSAKGILQCLSDYDVWEAVFKGDTLFSKRMIYP